jgi:RNA polymerase sigma-70 factor (ECF subfamily)
MVNGPSDLELLTALQRQEVSALEGLYDRYGSFAYALAIRILGDKEVAQDVVQEVFFNLWREARSFDGTRGSVRNWLLASTHHRAIDYLRRRQGKARRDVQLNEAEYLLTAPDLWTQVVNHADLSLLKEAMTHLPVEQKAVLESAYFQGMSHSEIAETMGIPLGTVKGRLRLALEKMKTYLQSKGIWTAG